MYYYSCKAVFNIVCTAEFDGEDANNIGCDANLNYLTHHRD